MFRAFKLEKKQHKLGKQNKKTKPFLKNSKKNKAKKCFFPKP